MGGASYVSRILKNNIQMTLVREEDLPRLVYVAVHWHDPRLSVVYCHREDSFVDTKMINQDNKVKETFESETSFKKRIIR